MTLGVANHTDNKNRHTNLYFDSYMVNWPLTYQRSVFKRYHSNKAFIIYL